MQKYLAEFIGTFTMVFCGTGAIVINEVTGGSVTHIGIAISFGLIVMAMIYSLGNISGAHMNPAVTVAFSIANRFPVREIFPYIISQLAGAFLASVILKNLFPESITLGATNPSGSNSQSLILEGMLTFFLMFVILSVSDGSKERGIIAGLAIGSVVLLEAMFAGPVSGASMNPVRSIAPAVVSGNIAHVWIYCVAPFVGAILAVPVHKIINQRSDNSA
jgi:aquaporin Z